MDSTWGNWSQVKKAIERKTNKNNGYAEWVNQVVNNRRLVPFNDFQGAVRDLAVRVQRATEAKKRAAEAEKKIQTWYPDESWNNPTPNFQQKQTWYPDESWNDLTPNFTKKKTSSTKNSKKVKLAKKSNNNFIPSQNGNYTIQSGDTLSKIAANNGMTVQQIMALNPQIKNANKIYAGHILNLNSQPIQDNVWMALASSKIENAKPIEDNYAINNLTTTKVTPEINTQPIEINPIDRYRRFEQYVDSIPNYNFDQYRTLDMNKLLEGLKQYI